MTRLACAMSLVLAGCAALPSSGPTGREVVRDATDPRSPGAIRLVELGDAATVPAAIPTAAAPTAAVLPDDGAAAPTDLVGPGDVLDIAIYEAGVTLFGGGGGGVGDAAAGFNPSARAERLPANRVDDAGYVVLPYAGRLRVAGLTVGQVAQLIRASLKGLSQNPQVLVSTRENITNSVIVGGEVARPGRLVLSTNRETLSDVVALAGGYRGEAKDLAVRIGRAGGDLDLRLSDVLDGTSPPLRIRPGDRVTVVRAPRSFSVMGAPGRVDLLPFSRAAVSLGEAIAVAGGSNPNLGDPKAIFVFRIERDPDGTAHNTVYHLNMMRTGSFFVAQQFAIRDKDVLYFGNAGANQPSKLIQLISQLFTPFVTVTSGVRTVQGN